MTELSYMDTHKISDRFLDYYQGLGFELLPSASLLDPAIPMTFVMSAGLVQVESSRERLGHPNSDRYVLCQKCFRHFDLDVIGHSNVHLSLFEMPGAFSFASNEKASTVERMWAVVTRVLGVDPSRLWVTYFGGGSKGGHLFPADDESLEAWRHIGIPDDRIVALGPEDNFWMQGGGIDGHEPCRKCGPNTELFFDRGESLRCGAGCRPGCRCGRWIEFANSLFIFAEIDEATGALRLMEQPFNETVIGTERVAMIVQGRPSIFQIDCMVPLIDTVQSFCNGRGADVIGLRAKHVISDYVRALLFLVADGAPPPGKGGRQRIVKLLIRGVLTQQQILGLTDPSVLPDLVDAVLATHGQRYPHLAAGRPRLLAYFDSERARFEKTLQQGYRQLDRLVKLEHQAPSEEQVLSLVKDFGLPLPLIETRLRQTGHNYPVRDYQHIIDAWQAAHAGRQ